MLRQPRTKFKDVLGTRYNKAFYTRWPDVRQRVPAVTSYGVLVARRIYVGFSTTGRETDRKLRLEHLQATEASSGRREAVAP